VDILGVDLNLLGPLIALLEERHVSRAAERAHMSQPAMSRTLSKLRIVFDDELLVRAPGGYRLTPRAERLQRELAVTVPQLEGLFSEQPFDPFNAVDNFHVAGTDYLLSVVGPGLVRHVRSNSPGSTLRFDAWRETVYDDLERGALDLVFAGGAVPSPFRSEHLFEDRYVCLLSTDHPLHAVDRLSLKDYLDCDHVVVDIAGGRQGAVDVRLEALGHQRRASVIVPYHAFAAGAIRETNLVATLPRRFVDGLVEIPSQVVIEAPAAIGPVSFSTAWHPRLDNDPAHCWLRETVRATANQNS
jgi:DNA-binding transcriptional LysR family regulator